MENKLSAEIYITRHAVEKFLRRSGQITLSNMEGRDNIRFLLRTGEEGTREGQPIMKSQGWLFVLSDTKDAVITCFYKPGF